MDLASPYGLTHHDSHIPHHHHHHHASSEEDAALEALRAAIGDGSNDVGLGVVDGVGLDEDADGDGEDEGDGLMSHEHGVLDDNDLDPALVESTGQDDALSLLRQLHANSTALIESTNAIAALEGLLDSYKSLVEMQKKQSELIDGIIKRKGGYGDTELTSGWVRQSEYNALQAKYDELASGSDHKPLGEKKRRGRPTRTASLVPVSTLAWQASEEKGSGRKKRSIRLEHLIHKHLNRLVGIEYTVSGYEVAGSSTLLPPSSHPPSPTESINGIQEYRPDYEQSSEHEAIKALLDVVVREVWDTWQETRVEEDGVDMAKVTEGVNTYWARLMKRWQEQKARSRGELHRDEIARWKQNQYRRQQSLVARRSAAFDQSPLNSTPLRALYRTLLTINFAPPTNEKPDPQRSYSDAEWYAYRHLQLGSQAEQGHEVVDIFWLSPSVRYALSILDKYSDHYSSSIRRKGKPKAPSPVFHLPRTLWASDRARLPVLTPKDENGLPVAGSSGVVLFDWHVDEEVRKRFPDWAMGLYDTPPAEGESAGGGLDEALQSQEFAWMKDTPGDANVPVLNAQEVERINAMPLVAFQIYATGGSLGGQGTQTSTLQSQSSQPALSQLHMQPQVESTMHVETDWPDSGDEQVDGDGYISLEQAQAVASAVTQQQLSADMTALGQQTTPSTLGSNPIPSSHPVPSPVNPNSALGTSSQARKQSKRSMSSVPPGAATPVPKRLRSGGSNVTEGAGMGRETTQSLTPPPPPPPLQTGAMPGVGVGMQTRTQQQQMQTQGQQQAQQQATPTDYQMWYARSILDRGM